MDYCDNETLIKFMPKPSQADIDLEAVKNLYKIFVPILLIGCLLSLLLNTILVVVGTWNQAKQSQTNRSRSPILLLSLNLAATDGIASFLMGIGLLVNSFLPVVFNINISICSQLILEIFRLSALIASALHLLALALVHYKGIVNPLHYRSVIFCSQHRTRSIYLMSFICWFLPSVVIASYFGSIPCQGFQNENCRSDFILTFRFRVTIVVAFFVPLIWMFYLYIRIFTIIKRHQKQRRIMHRLSTKSTLSAANSSSIIVKKMVQHTHSMGNRSMVSEYYTPTKSIQFNDENNILKQNCSNKTFFNIKKWPSMEKRAKFITKKGTSSSFFLSNDDNVVDVVTENKNNNNYEPSINDDLIKKKKKILSKKSTTTTTIDDDTQDRFNNDMVENGLLSSSANNQFNENEKMADEDLKQSPISLLSSLLKTSTMFQDETAPVHCDSAIYDASDDRVVDNDDLKDESNAGICSSVIIFSQTPNLSIITRSRMPSHLPTTNTKTTDINGDNVKNNDDNNDQPPLGSALVPPPLSSLSTFETIVCCNKKYPTTTTTTTAVSVISNEKALTTSNSGRSNQHQELFYPDQQLIRHHRKDSSIKLPDSVVAAAAAAFVVDDDEHDINDHYRHQQCQQPNDNNGNDNNNNNNNSNSNIIIIQQQQQQPRKETLTDTNTGSINNVTNDSLLNQEKLSTNKLTTNDTLYQQPELFSYNNNNNHYHHYNHFKDKKVKEFENGKEYEMVNEEEDEDKDEVDEVNENENDGNGKAEEEEESSGIQFNSNETASIPTTMAAVQLPFRTIKRAQAEESLIKKPNMSLNRANTVVYDNNNRKSQPQSLAQAQPNGSSGHAKALITTLLILGTYIICWMPAVVFFALTCIDHCHYPITAINYRVRVIFSFITNGLVILKAIVDPFIYTYRMKEMKTTLNSCLYLMCPYDCVKRLCPPKRRMDYMGSTWSAAGTAAAAAAAAAAAVAAKSDLNNYSSSLIGSQRMNTKQIYHHQRNYHHRQPATQQQQQQQPSHHHHHHQTANI